MKYLHPLLVAMLAISCSKNSSIPDNAASIETATKSSAAALADAGAAPSMHLVYNFNADGFVRMQKVKITQTGTEEYFETTSFKGGYCGLQQVSSTARQFIFSIWDPNTAGGVYAQLAYKDATTTYSRFGGEGDGAKTTNPYNWQLNTWYNVVHRGWRNGSNLYIATFIQDVSSGNWFHTATIYAPYTGYVGDYNDTFLENWVQSGSTVRKAYFKDCWNMNLSNVWIKPTAVNCSVNDSQADRDRNGIYHNRFDAGYDATQNAYFMAHGGSTTPSSVFNGGRTATLPLQQDQGTAPVLTTGAVSSVAASYANNVTNVSWTTNTTRSPQFISKVEIVNASGTVVASVYDTLPQKRAVAINQSLANGTYKAKVTITDIFNQVATPVENTFVVSNSSGIIANAIYELKAACAPGRNLDVAGASTTTGTNVSVYTDNNGNHQRWKAIDLGNGYYRLAPAHSLSGALDVINAGTTAGVRVQYAISNGSDAQKWKVTSVGSGYYKLQPACAPALCLDVTGGLDANANVEIWTDNGGNAQKWKFELISLP